MLSRKIIKSVCPISTKYKSSTKAAFNWTGKAQQDHLTKEIYSLFYYDLEGPHPLGLSKVFYNSYDYERRSATTNIGWYEAPHETPFLPEQMDLVCVTSNIHPKKFGKHLSLGVEILQKATSFGNIDVCGFQPRIASY